MRKILLPFYCLLAGLLWINGAHAQGYQCRTSPVGAKTAYCASEAFVTNSSGFTGQPDSETGNVSITATSGKCGLFILASGGQNTITLASPSGFPPNCVITVKDDEIYSGVGTARGKILSGFPSDISATLYPQQVVQVSPNATGSAWKTVINPKRWKNPTAVTLCVDPSGSDLNDGLAGSGSGCLATGQAAINIIQSQFDLQQTTPVVAFACGVSHTSQINFNGQPTGNNLVQFSPNCSSSGPTFSNAAACINVGDQAQLTFNATNSNTNFTFACNTGNTLGLGAVYCHNYCTIDMFGPGAFIFSGGGANDSGIYVDGPGALSIGNGNTFQLQGTFGNFIEMNEGGKMTFSGNSQPASAITIARLFDIMGRSMLIISGTQSGGYGSVGASTIHGGSIFVSNSVSIPGGTSATGSGHICTSLTDVSGTC